MNVVEDRPDIVGPGGELIKQRPRVKYHCQGPSLTRQEFKEECDLELILKRFAKLPEGRELLENIQGYATNLRFDDVSAIPDYRAARDAINAANSKFMALPAKVRTRFENDPALFLDFIQNPANLDEARALGLCKPVQRDAAVPKEKGA